MLLTAIENRKISADAIAEKCDLDISRQTVSKRLECFGLKRRIAAEKEELNANHIQNRLNFANYYSNLTFEDWYKFIFTGVEN
jgi:hypothetical protein